MEALGDFTNTITVETITVPVVYCTTMCMCKYVVHLFTSAVDCGTLTNLAMPMII